MEVYNNTVYNNNGGGILISSTNGIKLKNNIILSNNSSGDSSGSSNIVSDYNLWAPNKATWAEGTHSIIQSGTSGIVVNAGGGDFHLLSGSPAVDKGADLSATGFTIDIAGVTRPQGPAYDIGAYEYVVSSASRCDLSGDGSVNAVD